MRDAPGRLALDQLDRNAQAGIVDVGHRHPCPAPRELERQRAPDPRPGSSDDGNLAAYLAHAAALAAAPTSAPSCIGSAPA